VDSRNYLRLYIQYLRDKIEADPRRPRFIINEWGVGYRFDPSGSRALPTAPSAAA
jgi:two-component system KDP operon response regulator KdpE